MYEDKTLVCVDCGNEFVFTAGEQEFYAQKGFENEPKRCPECRAANKTRKRAAREFFIGVCAECGGEMKYAGLGEFRCVECGNVQFNDYGRVRAYLEAHPGAMQSEVSRATGVSPNRIRQLLVEERIEISANSNIFLNCEMCGMPIRSGSRCPKCEERYQKEIANEN